jgi:hypothetical protein
MPNVSCHLINLTWLEVCLSHKIPTTVRRSLKSYSVMSSHNLILVFIVRFIIINVWINFTERFMACFNFESLPVFSSSTYIIHTHIHTTHTHTHTYTALLHILSLCLFHNQTTSLFSSFTIHLLGFPFLNHFVFDWMLAERVSSIKLKRSNSIITTRSSVSHNKTFPVLHACVR